MYFADPDDPDAFFSQTGFAFADEFTSFDRDEIRGQLESGDGLPDYGGSEDEFMDFLDLIPAP